MTPSALWTAAHHQLPALIVVANNQSYFNDEEHQERVARTRGRPIENRGVGQRMAEPAVDFAALARSLGVGAVVQWSNQTRWGRRSPRRCKLSQKDVLRWSTYASRRVKTGLRIETLNKEDHLGRTGAGGGADCARADRAP